MELIDGQYVYEAPNGLQLAMGQETPIQVVSVAGLLGWQAQNSGDIGRSADHGSIYGHGDWMLPRSIIMDIVVDGQPGADVEALLDELHTVFQSTEVPGMLMMKRRGKEARQSFCKPRRAEFLGTYDSWLGHIQGSIEFYAADPRFYEETLHTETLMPPSFGMGRGYPKVYPKVYGGITGELGVLIPNTGNCRMSPVVRVKGPCRNPSLTNATLGQNVTVGITLAAGQTLELNFETFTATVDGADAYWAILGAPQWWPIEPGDNYILFHADAVDSGPTPTAELLWRSCWNSG